MMHHERSLNAKDQMIEAVRDPSPWLVMMRDIVRAEVHKQLTQHKEQSHGEVQH